MVRRASALPSVVGNLPLDVATWAQGASHFSSILPLLPSLIFLLPSLPLSFSLPSSPSGCWVEAEDGGQSQSDADLPSRQFTTAFTTHSVLTKTLRGGTSPRDTGRGTEARRASVIPVRPLYWLLSDSFLFQNHSLLWCWGWDSADHISAPSLALVWRACRRPSAGQGRTERCSCLLPGKVWSASRP